MSNSLTIREMSEEFDVTARTLRFYEAKELLFPIREGQKRLFTKRDRARLKLIVKGKRFGFSLEEIRQLLADNQITDFAELFRLLYDEVDGYGKGHVAECILIIARYELSDSQVVDKEINAMAMIIELLGVIK